MRVTRSTALTAAALALALMLASCSSSSSDDDANSATTTSQPSGSATTTAPSSATQTVPVTVHTGADDETYLTVEVQVGGGQAVSVLLDTGSGGLIMASDAVGSSTTSTGASFTQEYGSGTATTEVVQAPVSIGSLATPSPIAVGVIQGSNTSGIIPSGVSGILGIDSTLHTTNVNGVDLYSPLQQLGGSLAQGFTVEMSNATSASLVVGPVTPGSGAVTLPLSPASQSYPDGSPVYEKYVQLCWTAGSASSCEDTTLDTGSTNPVVAVAGAPHESNQITPGTSVTVAAPNGGPTLWQFSAASQGPEAAEYSAPSQSNPPSNSGIAFFVGKQVGFDYANGRIVVTSN